MESNLSQDWVCFVSTLVIGIVVALAVKTLRIVQRQTLGSAVLQTHYLIISTLPPTMSSRCKQEIMKFIDISVPLIL